MGGRPIEVDFPAVAKVNDSAFTEYAGDYRPSAKGPSPAFPIRLREGQLFAAGPNNTDLRLWPAGKEQFFFRHFAGRIRFLRNEKQVVDGADLELDGQRVRLKRVEKSANHARRPGERKPG